MVGSLRYLPATTPTWVRDTDIVIVGAGAAGLSAALDASGLGRRVTVLSKAGPHGGSTPLAQGGLAAVTCPDDSIESHVSDTVVAAAGLADETVVRELVAGAPEAVRHLAEMGVRFDGGPLGLEGGHSHRRIVHAGGDAIGAEVHRVLRDAVLAADVEILEHTVAIDVVKNARGDVVGVVAGRRDPAGQWALDVGVVAARAVVVATGGYGQVFASSTNPADVTGDGLALCARAGAEVSNVEFVQFHPTVLYVADQRGQSPLLTEALRGAGARIVDSEGLPVMEGRHDRGDLAPRDVVAYGMFQRMHSSSPALPHLWLDARAIGRRRLDYEFPTAVALCRRAGFDLAGEPVPIAPGAHYACGGVRTDVDGGSSLYGLYAIGEAASTGVHGANRLASNSLTEAVIGGRRLARHLDATLSARSAFATPTDFVDPLLGRGANASSREALAAAMTAHAGVVRSGAGLDTVLETLEGTPEGPTAPLDLAVLEATNLHTVSLLVTCAATLRTESRGCHRRSDFPETSAAWERPISLLVTEGDVVARVATVTGS
jgi:L-aspartate oxidase